MKEKTTWLLNAVALAAVLAFPGGAVANVVEVAQGFITVQGGTINTPQTTQAVEQAKAAITKSVEAVKDAIRQHGEDRSANTKQILNALGQLSANQNQVVRDTAVMAGAAAGKADAVRVWGAQGTDDKCLEGAGGQMGTGKAATRAAAVRTGGEMEARARSFGKGDDIVADINRRKPEDIKIAKLDPAGGVRSTADQAEKEKLSGLTVDASPPLKLSERSKNNPEGKRYEAARTLYEAYKMPARGAAADADAYKAPTFKAGGGWADDAIAEAGFNKADYTDSAGNFSYESFMRLQVDYRTANDAWYQNAKVLKDDVWQLRHINLSLAVALEMQKKQVDLLNRLVELEAKRYALEADRTINPELEKAREASVSRD